MKRPDLDAWFAKADDVLKDWHGSEDAMVSRSRPDDADPELPLLGDNEADQSWPLPRRRPAARRPGIVKCAVRLVARAGRALRVLPSS